MKKLLRLRTIVAMMILAAMVSCGGNLPDLAPEYIDMVLCLAQCKKGECVKTADMGWVCNAPTPEPTPTPAPTPPPPEPPVPVCNPPGLVTGCWHCPPQPEGGCQWEFIPKPEPTPTPPPTVPGACPFKTPTARELVAKGVRVEIRPQLEGRANVSATPMAQFGIEYYCQPGLWPEACAANRTFGPVAPDGHPAREACEAQFLEAPCPLFTMARCTGNASQCPISFDPYYVIGGINQNHPRNARCDLSTWEPKTGGKLRGQWWIASAHGKGYVKACNFDESVCTEAKFETDW